MVGVRTCVQGFAIFSSDILEIITPTHFLWGKFDTVIESAVYMRDLHNSLPSFINHVFFFVCLEIETFVDQRVVSYITLFVHE